MELYFYYSILVVLPIRQLISNADDSHINNEGDY